MREADQEGLGKYFGGVAWYDLGLFRIVEFRSPLDAKRAIKDLHNSTLDGRTIYIREVRLATLKSAG